MTELSRLNTLANGLRVMECLIGRSLTMRQLAAECALPRQTTYRIVSTLISAGWVDRVDNEYRASPRIWSLAAQSFSITDLRGTHGHLVRSLAATYGETVHLAVYDRGSVIYIDKADGSNPIVSYTTLGGRAPAHCVATGKVLLAYSDANTQELALTGDLTRHTAKTLVNPADLRHELEQIKARGYAVNRGEWRDGVAGIAVPIWSPFHDVVCSLGFSGPSQRILGKLDALVLALREAIGADDDKSTLIQGLDAW